MKKKQSLIGISVLILMFSLLVPYVLADASDTSDGTATVTSAVPAVSSPELWNMIETVDGNNTALTVSTEYHVNFTVSDANTMADLKNVTVLIWYNGTGGVGKTDVDAQRNHYTYTWVESTDTWACPLAAGYIVQANCSDPGTAGVGTSYEFRLAFKLSKVGNYSNGAVYTGWQINITVYDDALNGGTFGEGTGGRLQFGVASYFEINVVDGTHTWSAAPNTADNAVSAGGDGKIDATVIANTIWKAQVEADGNLMKAPDYIAIANLTQYGSDTVGSSVPMTTGYADVTGLTTQAPPTDEAAPVNADVWLWLDIPTGTPSGDYLYQFSEQIVIQP